MSENELLRSPIIITALPMEFKTIRQAFQGHSQITVIQSGIGYDRAYRAGVDTLRNHLGASLVISAGLAGSLSPELRVGDVIVSYDLNSKWLFPEGSRIGKVTCSKSIVKTPEEKKQLWARTGGIAVDMESGGVEKAALEYKVPFLAVKSISDSLNAPLPPEISTFLDPNGELLLKQTLSCLIRRPRLIFDLLRLGRDSQYAVNTLALYLYRLLVE